MGLQQRVEIVSSEDVSLGLSLPASTTFERWQEIGRELAAREKVLNWWIGDWWAFGEAAYGERAKVAAESCFGKAFQTLMNAATVCRAFETSRRREVLDWSHHAEVAGIARHSPEAADELLDRAEREGLSKARVREEVRKINVALGRVRPPPDEDSELASFLRHWNRLSRDNRMAAAELIADAGAEEIEPA